MAFEDFLSSIFGGGAPQQAAAPAAPAPVSAPGGFAPTEKDEGGFLGKILPSILIGGGGALASHLLGRGADKDINRATKGLRGIANIPGAKQMVERAAAGKLTDPQQAQVDRMKAEQNARWGQYLGNLGIPVSSAQVQSANLVDQEALKMANDLINQSWSQGMQAYSLMGSANQKLLESALARRKDLSKTIWDVAAQIGRVLNTPEEKKKEQQQSASPVVPPEWQDQSEMNIASSGLPESMNY